MFDRRFATQSSTKKEAFFRGKKIVIYNNFFFIKRKKINSICDCKMGPQKRQFSLWVLNKPKKIIFWSKFDTISAWVQKKIHVLILTTYDLFLLIGRRIIITFFHILPDNVVEKNSSQFLITIHNSFLDNIVHPRVRYP